MRSWPGMRQRAAVSSRNSARSGSSLDDAYRAYKRAQFFRTPGGRKPRPSLTESDGRLRSTKTGDENEGRVPQWR